VGFALAKGALEVFAIFAALGIGLALPYLIVAAVPALARLLPRPGRWMIGLRRVLGFALALTAVWLLSVFAVQVGEVAAAMVAVLMAGLVLALWFGQRAFQPAGAVLAGLLALAAFAMPALFGPPAGTATAATDSARWTPFVEADIRRLVGEGRTVFVDVTADWCITCQANKKLVLNRGDVAKRFESDEALVAMRADWTRPDEAISRYLASHNRYGIPFNMVYGPGAPEGIALPELLTDSAVLDALNRAAGRS
jgi:suppressor for copper-sensitivity B